MLRLFVAQSVRFLIDDEGPTAVEYAVMLALIIVVCAAGVAAVGSGVNGTFSNPGLNSVLSS